jgi:predicted ArsR family transcriptional regulator
MTVPGEVTFKVKQFIAARERFTTGQVAKLTGLNRKSVETVVQRLIRDGYVVKSRETAPGIGRGRRPLYYALTADMRKRKELVNEVSAFQPRAVPVRVRPLSANYIGAHDMLDELEQEPDAPDREARLAKIEKHLELAAFEEGLEDGEEGTAVVQAYLLREKARVAALRHQWARAESLLNQARPIFQEHGLEEEVDKLEGIIAGQELERTLTEGPLDHGRLSHILKRLGCYAVASVPVHTVCRLVGVFQETLQAATAVEPEEERRSSLARSLETLVRQQPRGEVALSVARGLEMMAKLELSKVGMERISEEVANELAAVKRREVSRMLSPASIEPIGDELTEELAVVKRRERTRVLISTGIEGRTGRIISFEERTKGR